MPVDAAAAGAAAAAAAAAAAEVERDPDNIDVVGASADGEKVEKVKVAQVVVGYAHMLARTEDGKVYSWGCNLHGQLGLGDHKDRATPSLVSYLSEERVVAVATGRVGVYHFSHDVVLQPKHQHSVDDSRCGPRNQSDTWECVRPSRWGTCIPSP
jgi:hypothetical protein